MPGRGIVGEASWTAQLRAPVSVAIARLRAHPARGALVAVGVTLSTGLLVGVLGGSLIARDRAVQDAVAALPPSERSFRVDTFELQPYGPADRAATRALRWLTAGPASRAVFLHQLRIAGELTQLGAIDELVPLVRLRSGRLPKPCNGDVCEVVQIGGHGKAQLDEAGIHLVRVGIAAVPPRTLFGDSLAPAPNESGRAVLLLARGVRRFLRVPAFASFPRDYAWAAALPPSGVHVWSVGRMGPGRSSALRGLVQQHG